MKLKNYIYIAIAWLIVIGIASEAQAQYLPNCVTDTTGGYISIFNPTLHNPICNYELLTAEHLATVHVLKIDRSKIPFFPHAIDVLYAHSGDSRGHCVPFEDLAWSQTSATASMDENRNLAPEPQNQNIGTELASENQERQIAEQFGYAKVYVGTWGTLGTMKGINKPAVYWKIISYNGGVFVYWMPLTGNVNYHALASCAISYEQLVAKLGFDPIKLIGK